MLGGLFAEVCNLLVLTQRHDAIHCLEHFVAFEILTHVDNIYCHALPHFPLKDQVKEPLSLKRVKRSVSNMTLTGKLMYIFERILFWFYTLMFYYFTPFWIGAIPFLYKVGGHEPAAAGGH